MFLLKGSGCNLPDGVAETIGAIYSILIIAIPVIAIIFGMIDLAKAVASQKEDEIKRNQGIVIKRIIVAALAFFVYVLVKFVIANIVKTDNTGDAVSCLEQIFG